MSDEGRIAPKARMYHDHLRQAELVKGLADLMDMSLFQTRADLVEEWLDELQDINRRYLPEMKEIETDELVA